MPNITLKDDDVFSSLNEFGNFSEAENETGLFWYGTRHLSACELYLEEEPLVVISSLISDQGHSCLLNLTNSTIATLNPPLDQGTIHISRKLNIQENELSQNFVVTSFYLEPIQIKLELRLKADFQDIFEIRGLKRPNRGTLFPPKIDQTAILFQYQGLDHVLRETQVSFSPFATRTTPNSAIWELSLQKGVPVTIKVLTRLSEQSAKKSGAGIKPTITKQTFLRTRSLPAIKTDDLALNQLLQRGIYDLTMICTTTPQGLYPYGGIPWFVCPFGRDGLITSLTFLPWFPEIVKGTLAFLAEHQGKKEDAFTEEQPGKILHEFRRGEMANCREIPYIPYYGSIDATPLFILTLAAYFHWTNDLPFLIQLWPAAQAAAHWMLTYGDSDGDSFLESCTTSEKGLINQGWKDSFDSTSHRDGRLAANPLALCEVQGYAYAAYRAMSTLAKQRSSSQESLFWDQKAEALQTNFLRHYWWQEQQTFYMALDASKQPCEIVTSNTGQCLWTGIVPDTLASHIINRLMEPDMYSGWGIRTLSQEAIRYNPMSYHNGSIWPHDTALVGAGFARYGRKAETALLLKNLSEAGHFFERNRLPELFCGFTRTPEAGPSRYPVACLPQAWAAGSPFLLLSAMLGIEPDAKAGRLLLHAPFLPDWLSKIEIRGLYLRGQRLDVLIECGNQRLKASVLNDVGINIEVQE